MVWDQSTTDLSGIRYKASATNSNILIYYDLPEKLMHVNEPSICVDKEKQSMRC
jgi:hypothetical protein